MTTDTQQAELPTASQLEAFPKTRVDLANEFLQHFQDDVESAEKAVVNANTRLRNAVVLRNDAEENLRRALDEEEGTAGVVDAMRGMKRTAEEAGIGVSLQFGKDEPVVIAEAPDVDPITGEIAGEQAAASAAPVVTAVYCTKDGERPVATEIGEHTTYGELAADYAAATGFGGELVELAVIGEDDGMPRRKREKIDARGYGDRLLVAVLADSPQWQQCPTCDGDGRQLDKSGGGHHGVCERCEGRGCVEREEATA